ncbi:hypothetical protein SLS53_005319 [Cytospora paraplurivora]|uniref:Uncharacterized protein n=1 Tax=Cytospora paraplurivora TaxID=2898453 RepID=A0AAN9U5Q8_9PEZI
MFESLAHTLRRGGASRTERKVDLPLYSPIATEQFEASSASPAASASDLDFSELENAQHSPTDHLSPAQRHAGTYSSPTSSSCYKWPARPSLSRFLADFTLGFADGLTVPFALTAGLSSLGQTDTVIYAGMAEICAGSISMGIGGYLSAKGEAREAQSTTTGLTVDTDEDEKIGSAALVESYLSPLDLPSDLLGLVHQHIASRSGITPALARKLATEDAVDADDEADNDDDAPPSSIIVGLSVAAGYLIGGSLPLSPYFLVSHVGDGLMWSFIVCVIALFSFGFAKDFILYSKESKEGAWANETGYGKGWKQGIRFSWKDIKRSAWEGLLMVMLGSMAALAAVLCVRLFEGMGQTQP